MSEQRAPRRLGKEVYEGLCRVYFVEAVGMSLVKIGYTLRVPERFAAMLTASPARLSLLACTTGGPQVEAALHARLDAYRAHGEWFHKTPEVEAEIAAAERHYGEEWHNRSAPKRGEALKVYLARMKAGEVTRPTRGPLKHPAKRKSRYDWSPSDPFRKDPT